MRRKLAGAGAKWTVLGQSFGGFCLLTYLSTHPEALKAGLFTGGLPPVGRTPDEVNKTKSTRNHRQFLVKPRCFCDEAKERRAAKRPGTNGGACRMKPVFFCFSSGSGGGPIQLKINPLTSLVALLC